MPSRDWPAVRPFRFFPDLEPHRSDTRNSTFVPEGSVDTDIVEELSVTKVTGIGVKIYNTNAQTIAASGTEATVSFGSEAFPSREPEAANRFYGELAGKSIPQARRRSVECCCAIRPAARRAATPPLFLPEVKK